MGSYWTWLLRATEVGNDKRRLLGHQVSGPRRDVSNGTFLGLTSTSLHLSLQTFGRKLDFFLSLAQHSRRFFVLGGPAGILLN